MSTDAVVPQRPYLAPPDDLTVPQLMFSYDHPTRPVRPKDLPCLIDDETGRAVFFEDLKERTEAFAAWLRASGKLGVDDVLAFCSPNHVDYGPVCWGVHEVGGIVAAMSPALTVPEMQHQFRIASPKIIIAHPLTLPTVQSAVSKQTPKPLVIVLGSSSSSKLHTFDEVVKAGKNLHRETVGAYKLVKGGSRRKMAFLCFSSGTTGPPKAVAISHYNVVTAVLQMTTAQGVNDPRLTREQARFRVGDVTSGVLPFFHIYGLAVNLHFNIFSAMTVVTTAVFNFEKMLNNIVKYKISILFIVPPQATLLVKHPSVPSYDLTHIHSIGLAAAPLSAELASEVVKRYPSAHFGQGFGMTEATGGVSMWPLFPKVGRFGSCGAVLPAGEIKIVKADGTPAGKGEPGELLVRGDYVALGYYKDDVATRETFLDGGWLRSGDEVVLEEDGSIAVVDRIKELIKVKGLQVSPAELEGHLLIHPDVADVGVVGVPDDYAGELPVGFIVLKDAAKSHPVEDERAKIAKHVQDAKSRYKWLKEVHFVDAIPRNPSGKILRRVLRDEYLKGKFASRAKL
ncbi:phenylacetyl-CoA ligase [Trametopsis cervina]|nr:phenylacetyl-CoA ligase [Trametopsis cervina]